MKKFSRPLPPADDRLVAALATVITSSAKALDIPIEHIPRMLELVATNAPDDYYYASNYRALYIFIRVSFEGFNINERAFYVLVTHFQ